MLLRIENLSISFQMYEEHPSSFLFAHKVAQPVISDLSLEVDREEFIAIVGASGSGKTLLADAILGMFDSNELASGTIYFDGIARAASELQALRGGQIAYVPQGIDSLDPLMKVGRQVRGVASDREDSRRRERRQAELFERYGLAPEVADLYPHELSGGMARRILLCSALIEDPKLLIADEPTPGMDPVLAEQAMKDLREFAHDGGSVLLITHDIALAIRYADRIAVFADGTIIEEAPTSAFDTPDTLLHPFTKALWHAMPEHGLHENMKMEAHL